MRPRSVPVTGRFAAFATRTFTVSSARASDGCSTRESTWAWRSATGPVARRVTSRKRPIILSGGEGFQSTKVMARSVGVGAATSIARTLVSPARMNDDTSSSNTREAPAICFESATSRPLSQMAARKLRPSSRSQWVLPLASTGTGNSVRYHHGTRYGLSSGISRLEKFWPIG
jgi:hypothetical protein